MFWQRERFQDALGDEERNPMTTTHWQRSGVFREERSRFGLLIYPLAALRYLLNH